MPVLSVIIPAYNSAAFLERSARSVLDSTFKDLELILVNDGSTDGSAAICDRLASEDNRVTVIHKPNGGASSARNKGLEIACGSFVAFVDSDDFVDTMMYDRLLCAALPDNDIALCDMMLHYQNGDRQQKTLTVESDRKWTICNLLLSGIGGGPCHMVIRRSIIGDLRFPEHLICGEDLWFVLRLFTAAGVIVKVQEPLYFYNQENVDSITKTLSEKTEASIIQGMRENRDYLQKKGLFEDVKQAFYWSVLRFKSLYALDPERLALYRSIIPEANKYRHSCPLLSKRIKAIMGLLDLRLDFLVKPICLYANRKK